MLVEKDVATAVVDQAELGMLVDTSIDARDLSAECEYTSGRHFGFRSIDCKRRFLTENNNKLQRILMLLILAPRQIRKELHVQIGELMHKFQNH